MDFFEHWNGVFFFLYPSVSPLPDLVVASDANRELVPIVVAAHVWGQSWFRQRVQFLSDNTTFVAVLIKGSAKSLDLMILLRILTGIACRYCFVFSPLAMSLGGIIALLTLFLVFRSANSIG